MARSKKKKIKYYWSKPTLSQVLDFWTNSTAVYPKEKRKKK